MRAELAGGASLETRDARMARRAQEIRALMTRECQRLHYGVLTSKLCRAS
jgi:hypothetical protein